MTQAPPGSKRAWLLRALARAGWAPLLVFGFHLAALFGLGLYTLYPRLDDGMHIAGGAAIAYFFLTAWRAAVASGAAGLPARLIAPILILSLTALAALGWELGEFCSDRLLGTGFQQSLEDTMQDLLYGMAGGSVVTGVSAGLAQPGPSTERTARDPL